jgi:hypothetical protein
LNYKKTLKNPFLLRKNLFCLTVVHYRWVDHGFALQHCDRKEIIARQRWSPSLRRQRQPSEGSPAWRQWRFAPRRSGLASVVSSGLLNCWVSIGSVEGGGKAFMARLLDGRESILRSLPETALGKQPVKLKKTNHRNTRFAHLHVGARSSIQHPLCNLDDLTRPDLYPKDRPIGPVFATFMPKTTAVIWMPAIMKLYHLPDMGRMNL